MSLRTPIKNARGLGASKEGVHHWIVQRLTAIALIPLCLWFAFSLSCLLGSDYQTFQAWMAKPLNSGLMVLFMATMFWHSMLGIQVILEDYVQPESAKVVALIVSNLFHIALGVITLIAVLRIAFVGA